MSGNGSAKGAEAGQEVGGSETGDGAAQPAGAAGAAGQVEPTDCKLDADCGKASSDCTSLSCVDGACVDAPLAEETACDQGACDGLGDCVESSCMSGAKDGDETGKDCGGSCQLCGDGEGCQLGTDCRSGVCTNQECQPSDCTDEVLNGSETDVDCGGSCNVKCDPGKACASTTDCVIDKGRGAESVRCLAKQCTHTNPPGEGLRYWQDFERLRLGAFPFCHATDGKTCITGDSGYYAMHGLNTKGVKVPLEAGMLFTSAGAVGSGGKFDGSYCLTRDNTNLTMAGASALTVMAWVKPAAGRSSPYTAGAIFGAFGYYVIAVDSNPASERFMAALQTGQPNGFEYQSTAAIGQVVAGEWHHVAATYDTVAGKFLQYVDGAEVEATPMSGTISGAKASAFIGCRKAAALEQFLVGTLDEVALYTRALSASELSDYVRRSKPTE